MSFLWFALLAADIFLHAPLIIAFDSNSAINTACVCQVQGRQLRTLKSFFVKTPAKLEELVRQVCEYYKYKIKRDIIFFYDHTFVWTTGNNAESYKDTIIRVLNEYRWDVTDVYIGQTSRHDWRHEQIDRALKNDPDLLYPVFNMYHNEFLKLAMEQTAVKVGKNGFEKVKGKGVWENVVFSLSGNRPRDALQKKCGSRFDFSPYLLPPSNGSRMNCAYRFNVKR